MTTARTAKTSHVILSTTLNLEGYRIQEYKGLVRGLIVRAPNIGQQILGGLKSIIGGKIGSYREMCEHARQEALDEMTEHARSIGANAVIGVHYTGSEVAASRAGSSTEVLCYGTAVLAVPLDASPALV